MYGLPGHRRRLSPDTTATCETEGHEDRQAVWRVQGETDSFGAEYSYYCQACIDAGEGGSGEWYTGTCPKCHKEEVALYGYRDPDEGLGGPVYPACHECRTKILAGYFAQSVFDF
jgi:hypothetical protein